MVSMQAKRIQIKTETGNLAGGSTVVLLAVPTTPRESVNFHNIWGSLTVEPTTAGANASGQWVLFVQPVGVAVVAHLEADINLEEKNPRIIACGVFAASNQTPFNMSINPKTSRNLNAGDRLILQITLEQITSGQATHRLMLCAHVVRA